MRQRRGFTLVDLLVVRNRERAAFTIIELLVVLGLIGIVIIVGCKSFGPARHASTRIVCENNLAVIGRKYNDYANDSANSANPFPRHIDDGNAHDTTAATGLKTANTVDAAIGTCGMQSMWVMVDLGYLTGSIFKCPGDGGWTSRSSILDKYGWSVVTEFSYGIHYPYASNGAGTKNPADPNAKDATGGGRLLYRVNLPLFADRNPGGAVDGTTVMQTNHPEPDGGCVTVSRVGNVSLHQSTSDSMAGFADDIYINKTDIADPVPGNASDTVITPKISR